MHLVLTGSTDLLVRYWQLCLYFSMDSFYVLRFDRTELTSGVAIGDEGVDGSFEVVAEVSQRCASGN